MAATTSAPAVRFFRSTAGFRGWLEKHAGDAPELWVGFYTKASGKGGMTYPEAVDEALCFGWIDGVRRKTGEDAYMQRFSPRVQRSAWSVVNLRRFEALRAAGRVSARGLEVFEARDAEASGFSFSDRPAMDATVERAVRADPAAWAYFEAQPPWYRRNASWWVTSAKREATRERRLATLVADCAAGQRISVLDHAPRRKPEGA